MNALKEKLLKNSTLVHTAMLENSKVYGKADAIVTDIPIVNVALSGEIDGGMTPGLLTIAGPSKHFKTMFSLLLAAAFMQKYPDGTILFYDSEFGTNAEYIKMFDIPVGSIVHCPIADIEELKHDIMFQLKNITRGDRVFILIDSVGNLASRKEVEDAEAGKSVADMTRAKALKSLFRMITPHLTIKDIPMVVVNHTYKEIGLFPKDIVGGGTGSYYSSNAIWIIGRSQEKDGTDLTGFKFTINIEKSRYVREKSKLPVEVDFGVGINKWSGLFDLALELGILVSPTKGWYSVATAPDKKFRKDDVAYDDDFWTEILETTNLKTQIKNRFTLGGA